jgi:copper chaperone CopZ
MRRGTWIGATLALGVLAAIALGPWLVRQVRTLPRASELAARADQRVVTLDVGGMTCTSCAAKIEGDLAALPGVSAVEVRLEQRQAIVVCAPSVRDTALTATVGRAGPGYLAAIARD